MPTPEGKIEAYLVERVKETGGRIRKLKWLGRNNAPDRILWWPAFNTSAIFVEVKAPGKKPTIGQAREHAAMRADGLSVRVVDSIAGVDDFIAIFANEHEAR